MDMMTTDESPSQISDKIKEILFNKSAERVDAFKTDVANGLFGDGVDAVSYTHLRAHETR